MKGATRYNRSLDTEDGSSLSKLLRWVKPESKVLEVGPATGYMTRHLSQVLNCKVSCIEIDSEAAKIAREFAETMIVRNVEGLSLEQFFQANTFDYVIFADVLEHLVDPMKVLLEVQNFLKSDGEILISVPNASYAGLTAELIAGNFQYRDMGCLDSTHLRYFTRKSLKEILKHCGLSILDFDRTVLSPESSEFSAHYHNVPQIIKDYLALDSDWNTYQLITRTGKTQATKQSDLEVPKEDIEDSNLFQVFWDTGGGFSPNRCITRFVKCTEERTSLDLEIVSSKPVRTLRIDPMDLPIGIRFHHIGIKASGQGGADKIELNQDDRDPFCSGFEHLLQVSDESDTFLSLSNDPQIIIPLSSGFYVEENTSFNINLHLEFSYIPEDESRKLLVREITELAARSLEQLKKFEQITQSAEHYKTLASEQDREIQHISSKLRDAKKLLEERVVELGNAQVELAHLSSRYQNLEERLTKLGSVQEELAQLSSRYQNLQEGHEGLYKEAQLLTEEKQQISEMYQKSVQDGEHLLHENTLLRHELNCVHGSLSWKLTGPLRSLKTKLKKPIVNMQSSWNKFLHSKEICRREGLSGLRLRLRKNALKKTIRPVQDLGPSLLPSSCEIENMKTDSKALNYKPLISIILPVYNPSVSYLKQAIQSVLDQAYENWELCIADDASCNPELRTLLDSYSQTDNRIKVLYRSENGHIAKCSNSALELATGEFCALLDHDDMLAPHALYEIAKCLNTKPDIDVIYSDEAKIDSESRVVEPACKGGWAPDYFMSFMYIGHLSCYRRELIKQVGGFRKGTEGSQDYDLALRILESTDRVEHVPSFLYLWRKHPESVCENIQAKPYAFSAAHKSLNQALKRRGLVSGEAVYTSIPGIYRSRYSNPTNQKVSFLIWNANPKDYNSICQTIKANTSYKEIELLFSKASESGSQKVEKLEDGIFALDGKRDKSREDFLLKACDIASGEIVLLYDSALKPCNNDWLLAMLEQLCMDEIAAVGPKIISFDNRVLSAGYSILNGRVHNNLFMEASGAQVMGARLVAPNNYSALCSNCLLIRRADLRESPALSRLHASDIAFDLDLCLSLRKAGRRLLWTPFAEMSLESGKLEPYYELTELGKDLTVLESEYEITKFVDPYFPPGTKPGTFCIDYEALCLNKTAA